jgi:hypothetical protein
MNEKRKNKMKYKDALLWVLLAGVAAHISLWLINESANAFYDLSYTGSSNQIYINK